MSVFSKSVNRSLGRRSLLRRPPAPSGRWWGKSPKSKDAARSGSPAAARSAASSPASWASTLVSTIAGRIVQNNSKPLVPKGLTSISRTSAAPCSRRCGRCSTILRAFPYAGSSRNTTPRPRPGPDMFSVLRKRLLLRGFIVSDFAARQADFLRDVGEWVRTGRLKYREDIVDGLENAPASFLGMLQGKNFGKTLVRVAP